MTNTAEYPDVTIRNLRPADLAAVIAIDALDTGLRRAEFYQLKLKQALSDTGIMVSLGAELDGLLVGFLLARVYYGEFGVLGRVAVLDAIGVHPDFQGRHVGSALIDQLRTNLLGLGIATLRTEVGWDNLAMIQFFHRERFAPAPRLCLDLDLGATRS
ncbi:MAG: GNAT family N-acetyltransferase [Vicinamibacterales bacterium]